ncbi:hypothetical protein [Oceanobacillus sp. FSL H7-0719]|uniref:hypothetical protein n=1 Tax=Oceanobacillus sp. FSL H7-0719 TaxID=2954507 RepID=UPI003253B47E
MKRVKLKSKGVAFNVEDVQQKILFDYANSKSNFSAHIKALLLKDMLGIPTHQSRRDRAVIDYFRD